VIQFPAVPPGEEIVVSATLYRTFLDCPQQALGRLQGTYGPESVPGFKGSLAHRLFARHLREGEIPDSDVATACRAEIGSGLNPKLGSLGLTKMSQLAPIIAEVGDLYARFKRFPLDGFRAAEVELTPRPADGLVLRGTVDAIFDEPGGGVRIVDWKTGSKLEGAAVQLDFYSLAWACDRGELPRRAVAISVATGEQVEIEPTEERALAAARAVVELIALARAAFTTGDELERRGGPHCRYCPLLETCREGAAAVELLSVG
jgi:hypothetical protein